MKRNILLFFTKLIVTLFIIGTVIMIFFAYSHAKGNIVSKIGMCYLWLVIVMFIYIPIVTILNSTKLKWSEIRGRLFRFIITFIVFGVLDYALDYIFRPAKVDLFREFGIAFGIAFGMAFGMNFVDVIFFKDKKNN